MPSVGQPRVTVDAWPTGQAGDSISAWQAPTRVAVDDRIPRRWGFQVDGNEEEADEWFKLGLVHPEYLPNSLLGSDTLEAARQLRASHDMTPSGVTEAYLRGLGTAVLPRAVAEVGKAAEDQPGPSSMWLSAPRPTGLLPVNCGTRLKTLVSCATSTRNRPSASFPSPRLPSYGLQPAGKSHPTGGYATLAIPWRTSRPAVLSHR
jgi:hypothetical protein